MLYAAESIAEMQSRYIVLVTPHSATTSILALLSTLDASSLTQAMAHSSQCSLSSLVDYLYLLSTYPLAGLSVVPNFIPPTEVRSSRPVFGSSSTRYNLNTGAAFNLSCIITHTSSAFTGYFYKDGVVISDGDLVNTTLTETVFHATQKCIQLQFLNFQPVHDGVYHCFANTSDTNEEVSSDLYLYGSGENCMWT